MSVQGDRFKAIADAIRAKKGTSDLIKASDFATEIASIEAGGETLGGEYNIEQIVDGDNCELVITTAGQPENKLAQLVDRSIAGEITAEDLAGATVIGSYAFYGCQYLNSVDLSGINYINVNAFYNCTNLKNVEFEDNTYIDDRAFMNSGLSGTVTVPYYPYITQTNKSLGDSVFEGCTKITKLIINSGSISMNNRCFYGCTNLSEVEFGESCTTSKIGARHFMNCSSLKTITLPLTVTGLYESCFANSGIETINLHEGLTSVSGNVFSGCSKLTNISLPSTLTNISNYMFYNCSSLQNINIPDSVTSIGSYAFNGCSSLISVTIGSGVTSLGTNAFYGCSNLPTITIPESVTKIGNSAFYICSNLTNIIIPSGVTSIEAGAFYGCSKLTEMTILATTPPTLGNKNAISTATTTIYIPAGTLSAYQTATNWSNFASKFVEMEA